MKPIVIHGNIQGIRRPLLDEMEKMYAADKETLRHQFISAELMDALAGLTGRVNREISVYIARDGMVMDVTVGRHDRVGLPGLRVRRGARRLTGVRCVHTHPDGEPRLSAVDESALRRMRFDAMAALGVRDGRVTGMEAGFLTELAPDGDYRVERMGPFGGRDIPHELLLSRIAQCEERIAETAGRLSALSERQDRAVLVGLDSMESLEELARLADTDGVAVLEQVFQHKALPDPATFVGSGKVAELSLLRQSLEANLVIVDEELTGAQIRNLEEALDCRVIDRTTLILDIFAGRAATHEGKLQVELAQYKYRLPRLAGSGGALSRLGGGIGTRGPGETKLESDRQRIRRRVFELEREVAALGSRRDVRRHRRERNRTPVVSLVGYTNAGKSTLLNALSGSGVPAEDRLFATLDPVTRRVALPGGREILLTDTVGFISKLPHDLIDAFRSTLEEAVRADLIVHVVDASSDRMVPEYRVAENVLRSLNADLSRRLVLLNKYDRVPDGRRLPESGVEQLPVSALTGAGLAGLLSRIEEILAQDVRTVSVVIPYAMGGLLSELHEKARILSQRYLDDGVAVEAEVSGELYRRVADRLKAGREEPRNAAD